MRRPLRLTLVALTGLLAWYVCDTIGAVAHASAQEPADALTFMSPAADDQTIYRPDDVTSDYALFSPHHGLEAATVTLLIDGVEHPTHPRAFPTSRGTIIRTGVSLHTPLADGAHLVEALLRTADGRRYHVTRKVRVDMTLPTITLSSPQNGRQDVTVSDNREVFRVSALVWNGERLIPLEGLTRRSGNATEADYEFTLPEGHAWDNIVYAAIDGEGGNLVYRHALDREGAFRGWERIRHRFFPRPPISNRPAPRDAAKTANSAPEASSSCMYPAKVYVPFWYIKDNPPSGLDYATQAQKAQQAADDFTAGFKYGVDQVLNPQLQKYGFAPLTYDPDTYELEIVYVPLEQNYWNAQGGHPYFDIDSDTPSSIEIWNPFFFGITGDPDTVDPYYPVVIDKPQDQEAFFIVDQVGNWFAGLKGAFTGIEDGYILVSKPPVPIPAGLFGVVIAHEMGHSLTLEHVKVDPKNLMCDGGATCTWWNSSYQWNATLSLDQARAISARVCGVPNTTLALKDLPGGSFGVNPYYQWTWFPPECGDGMVGYDDQCEYGLVEWTTNPYSLIVTEAGYLADPNYYCVAHTPVNGLAQHPDYLRYCTPDAPLNPDRCVCKPVPKGSGNFAGGDTPAGSSPATPKPGSSAAHGASTGSGHAITSAGKTCKDHNDCGPSAKCGTGGTCYTCKPDGPGVGEPGGNGDECDANADCRPITCDDGLTTVETHCEGCICVYDDPCPQVEPQEPPAGGPGVLQ